MANIMSIRPPETLRQKLKKTAKQQGYTVNHLVIQILWEWLEKKDRAI